MAAGQYGGASVIVESVKMYGQSTCYQGIQSLADVGVRIEGFMVKKESRGI